MNGHASNVFFRLVARIARVLGLGFDFTDGRLIPGMNEQDVAAQLHYGRE